MYSIYWRANCQLMQKERSVIYIDPALSGHLGHDRTDGITVGKLDDMQNIY